MAYDFTNAPDEYLRPVEYRLVPDMPMSPEYAKANGGLTSRWAVVLPGDDIQLYLEERRSNTARPSSDWRLILPNGKIKLASARVEMAGIIEGIAIARMLARTEPSEAQLWLRKRLEKKPRKSKPSDGQARP